MSHGHDIVIHSRSCQEYLIVNQNEYKKVQKYVTFHVMLAMTNELWIYGRGGEKFIRIEYVFGYYAYLSFVMP